MLGQFDMYENMLLWYSLCLVQCTEQNLSRYIARAILGKPIFSWSQNYSELDLCRGHDTSTCTIYTLVWLPFIFQQHEKYWKYIIFSLLNFIPQIYYNVFKWYLTWFHMFILYVYFLVLRHWHIYLFWIWNLFGYPTMLLQRYQY